MNVQDYIESGVLQDYCLGMLSEEEMQQVDMHAKNYTEVQEEIAANFQALEWYAIKSGKSLPANAKLKIFTGIDNIIKEEKAELNNLPLLNKYTDHTNWLKAVKPLLPKILGEEIFVHVLRDDEKVLQMLIWSKVDYPDEVHNDVKESFIILEGECKCYIGDDIIELGPGGFFEIPMFTHHDVKVTKGPVLAVVQRLKVA